MGKREAEGVERVRGKEGLKLLCAGSRVWRSRSSSSTLLVLKDQVHAVLACLNRSVEGLPIWLRAAFGCFKRVGFHDLRLCALVTCMKRRGGGNRHLSPGTYSYQSSHPPQLLILHDPATSPPIVFSRPLTLSLSPHVPPFFLNRRQCPPRKSTPSKRSDKYPKRG